MIIRKAVINDLDQLSEIESACFPPEQAAGRESIKKRLEIFPHHFLVMCKDDGKIVSFIDGFVTDLPDLTDEMYENASLHKESAEWQMVFGLNTLYEYRCRGYARTLMNEFLSMARAQGRKGVVLTCKEQLLHYYEKFGFVNEGITDRSVIGGVKWYQMRRSF